MNKQITLSALLFGLTLALSGCGSTPPAKKASAEPAKAAAPAATPAAAVPAPAAATPKLDVNIADGMPSVTVKHMGEPVTIMRNQNGDNLIDANYVKTSRKCPPFCIQPYELSPGVKTIAELEMLDYLKKSATDSSILIIDSRTPDWVERGTIPGSINIPWDKLNIGKSDPITVHEILTKQLGAVEREGFWDFSGAKTLVLFCNGQWCGQSPTNIKGLLRIGYPASKLVWYRGGMQEWETLGLTTIRPAK